MIVVMIFVAIVYIAYFLSYDLPRARIYLNVVLAILYIVLAIVNFVDINDNAGVLQESIQGH